MVSQASLEEKDVRLRVVDHVLHPPGALLDSKLPPLCLRHKSVGWHFFSHILHYTTVLSHVFGAIYQVLPSGGWHACTRGCHQHTYHCIGCLCWAFFVSMSDIWRNNDRTIMEETNLVINTKVHVFLRFLSQLVTKNCRWEHFKRPELWNKFKFWREENS